jgi:hypothetical protein
MILPYGLELPRVLVQLIVNIYSADVLLNYKMSCLERIRNRLSNAAYEWMGPYSKYLYSSISKDADTNNGESVLEMEVINEDEEKPYELTNLFVQITFCGVTVS